MGSKQLGRVQNYLDADTVSFVVGVVCQVGTESKPWARKESCRLLASLTNPDLCPLAESIFHSSSLLAKLCKCAPVAPLCLEACRLKRDSFRADGG